MLNSQFSLNIYSSSWDITHIPKKGSPDIKIKPTNQGLRAESIGWGGYTDSCKSVTGLRSIWRRERGGKNQKVLNEWKRNPNSAIFVPETKCDNYSPVYCFHIKAKPLLNRVCFPPCAGFEGDWFIFSLLGTHRLSRWGQNSGHAPPQDKRAT